MSVSFINSLGQFSNFHNAQEFLNDQGLLTFAGFRNSWKKEIYWSIIINNKHSVGVNAMLFRMMLTLIISAWYLVRQHQLKIESWKDLNTKVLVYYVLYSKAFLLILSLFMPVCCENRLWEKTTKMLKVGEERKENNKNLTVFVKNSSIFSFLTRRSLNLAKTN